MAEFNIEFARKLQVAHALPFCLDITKKHPALDVVADTIEAMEICIMKGTVCEHITFEPFDCTGSKIATGLLCSKVYSDLITTFGEMVFHDNMLVEHQHFIELLNERYAGMRVRFIVPRNMKKDVAQHYKDNLKHESVEFSWYDPWDVPDRILLSNNGLEILHENDRRTRAII